MTAVLFVPGLSILLGVYGYLFGSSRPEPTAETVEADRPSVEAFIPALNEEETIACAIASLTHQSYRPEKLTIVDDGSEDATPEVVAAIRDHVDLEIELISHEDPGGKTKRLKEVTRASSAEKIFVLDADTYLESERYLEQVVDAHGEEDVGCSFGIVRPDSRGARESFVRRRLEPRLPEAIPLERVVPGARERSLWGRIGYRTTRWPVEQYRSVMYAVEQSFFKESQMRLVGTTLFPAGCGVLYDRAALRGVVDDFEASLGDQLTNSEDVFIGFSLVDREFANVQVDGITMRTTEPSVGDLSHQTYLWSSSYLQSTYYYRSFSERLRAWTGDVTDGIEPGPGPAPDQTPPRVGSDGRETTGEEGTEPATDGGSEDDPSDEDDSSAGEASTGRPYGRTLGAVVASQVVDGLYPTALLVVSLLTALAVTPVELLVAVVAVEFALFSLIAGAFARRRITLGALLVAIPVRLYQLPAGVYVYARVATELLAGNRNWRK